MLRPDAAPCGLLSLDAEGRVRAANDTLAQWLGRPAAALAGLPLAELLAPAAQVYLQVVLWPALQLDGHADEVTLILRPAEGAPVHVLLNAVRRATTQDGEAAVYDCALFKVQQRRELEDRLVQAQRAVDRLPGILIRLLREPNGRYRLPFASKALFPLTGLDALQLFDDATPLLDALHPKDREMLLASLELSRSTLQLQPLTLRLQGADGQQRWMRLHTSVHEEGDRVLWHGALYDVTQQQRIDERLRDMDKLQAIATLAAGVAHDFNNLLGSITGLAELCQMDAVAETTQSRNLQRIIDAAGKAGALVRQLLDFSRQTPPQMEALRLSALLARTRPLLAAALPPGVQLQAQADADSLVQLDPSQMEQVLLNLVNNAAHAMRRDGGTVRIVVDHGEGGLGMPPMARLRVIDSGEGIAPALLPKIFEPFFTTKPVGVGTGLGLAAVHGIVTRHGGQIAVASEPGHGTTFTLLLPAAPVPAPDPIPLQGHHP